MTLSLMRNFSAGAASIRQVYYVMTNLLAIFLLLFYGALHQ